MILCEIWTSCGDLQGGDTQALTVGRSATVVKV